MKILVTGANGFIGRVVCRHLCEQGHEVFGLRRQDDKKVDTSVKMSWIFSDIFGLEIHNILKQYKFEGLVHLAWITNHNEYWVSNENILWVSKTLELLESFRIYGGKRVICAGSSAEYSWGSMDYFKEDNKEYNPQELYGNCKLSLKNMVESWAKKNNISWGWGRLFNVFGPYEHQQRLIPKTFKKLINNEKVSFDSGTTVRDFMYVDDTGKAFSLLFNSDFCGVVNIASGIPIEVKSLVEIIANVSGKESLLQFSDKEPPINIPKKIVADITILNQSLCYNSCYSLEEGLRETYYWIKQN
jgi:nucleoside-diphosphate-sugar epimerase